MGNNKYKILIIEDEPNISNFVSAILETNGYQVITADSESNGELLFRSHHPDLVILDLGLPDIDGMEFIRRARKINDTPLIVLSARTDENDKVEALDSGANDYVTKPFGTGELLARVRSALRSSYRNMRDGEKSTEHFQTGDLEINYESRQVFVAKKEIKLTQTEYNIVMLLSQDAGKVLTYAEIIRGVWGWSDAGSVKKLQVNMANIRKKIGAKPGENKYIINELGVGYRMNNTI